jgi:hypothetical protein
MAKKELPQIKTAEENLDFTFSISGSKHKSLSFDEFEKLKGLSGHKWIVFREHNSPHPITAKPLKFIDAM